MRFDPHDECVAAESHRWKKAVGKRAKRVNVVMVQQIPSRVLKGNQRNKLKEDGRIIELAFNRGMTSKETTRLIINAFREISGAQKIQFLQANRDNTMEVHTQLDLDENGVLSLAGSGSLYVRQMEESGDDLPDIKFGQQPLSSLTTSCETSTPTVPPETSTPVLLCLLRPRLLLCLLRPRLLLCVRLLLCLVRP